MTTASYLILTPPGEPPAAEKAAFIRDGFRWTAFFFPAIWLLVHRLWFWGVLALVAQFAASALSASPQLGVAGWVLSLAISILTALEGPQALVRAREAGDWTLRSVVTAPDLETASRSLGSRLRSLAKTHEILTQEDWSGASLTDLIDSALEPHAGVSRYEMRGDPVWLPPSLALSFSLAFQELTTNAVKYGALSNASGRVLISWEAEGSPTILRLVWREEGGPPVANDGRKGFGSRLLERVFEKRVGRIEVELLPHGLVCTIAAQIEEHVDAAQEEFGNEASA